MTRSSQQPRNCSAANTHWLALPMRRRQWAAGLLNQQCWLWGCDVRRAEGNLLLQHGFTKQPRPPQHTGSSAYRLDLAPDRTVILWAFGLFYGSIERGGVYLGRYHFAPQVLPALPAPLPYLPAELPAPRVPQTQRARRHARALLGAALGWVADYEAWALATHGTAYREGCVASWTRGPFRLPAPDVAPGWRGLAAQCGAGRQRRLRTRAKQLRCARERMPLCHMQT